MVCKECGHRNERVVFHPVQSPVRSPHEDDLSLIEETPIYKRWACEKCRRFHFPDGTLYTNPFRDR